MGSVSLIIPFAPRAKPMSGSVLLFSRRTGPCRDPCSRIYDRRARTKLGKPRALSSIVRHRSRKKRLRVRFYFTHTVSSRLNWKKIYAVKTAYKSISIFTYLQMLKIIFRIVEFAQVIIIIFFYAS